MYGLKKLEVGRYEYLGFTIIRTRREWRVLAQGDRPLTEHRTLRQAARALGDEQVPTRNLMTKIEIMIPRRDKGTALDPSQERYWTA